MQKDLTELKKIVFSNIGQGATSSQMPVREDEYTMNTLVPVEKENQEANPIIISNPDEFQHQPITESEIIEESLSLQDKEKEMIRKALDRHRGKRKAAAQELGISERTLYRKIKEYNIK
jgi:transcriptional regulator with PAS, ATPase and Fis domain